MSTALVSRGLRVEVEPGLSPLDLVRIKSVLQQIEQNSIMVNRRTFSSDARTTARYHLGILSVNG